MRTLSKSHATPLQYYNLTTLQPHIIATPTTLQPYSLTTLQHYNLTSLQPYSNTTLQAYNLTAVQPYIITTLQPYSLTALQPYSLTALQPTALQPYCLITLLKTINIQELYFLKKNADLRVLVQDFWENFLQRKESLYTYTYAKDT